MACLVKGSINVDEYFGVDKIAERGQTISSSSYKRRAGGKGANGAVAIAKAGGEVAFAGHIGRDGEWLRTELTRNDVRVDQLTTDNDLPTGRALIQVEKTTGENSIVLLKGANHPPRSGLPDLNGFTHLLVQNEIPFKHTQRALEEAQIREIITICNPSPVPEDVRRFEYVDWLILNEGEARLNAPEWDGRDPVEGARMLLVNFNYASTGVVMTLGARGAVVALGIKDDPLATFAEDANVRLCPLIKAPEKTLDTTGAGDCFTGYFVAMLMRLPRLPDFDAVVQAVEIACCAASISVEKEGTMESYPPEEEVEDRWDELRGEWPSWAFP